MLTVGAGWLLHPESELLLSWLPVLAIGAAGHLAHSLRTRVKPWRVARRENVLAAIGLSTLIRPRPVKENIYVPETWIRAAVYATVLLLVAVPFGQWLVWSRPATDQQLLRAFEPLAEAVPANGTILTDQPALVTWYTNRRAMTLCQREDDLVNLEKRFGPVHAIYVTTPTTLLADAETGLWWPWVISARGIYHGLAPTRQPGMPGRLRLTGQ